MPSPDPREGEKPLTSDQYRLYKLIWDRFTASLMANCVHDTCQADIAAGKYLFKASGYTVRFEGYTVLYVEGKDEETETGGPPAATGGGDGADPAGAQGQPAFHPAASPATRRRR